METARPCRPVLDLLEKTGGAWREKFRIRMVPFSDSPGEFGRLQQRLGEEIDCFASPCDSVAWREELSIFQLGTCRCCVTVPATHRLAGKKVLAWQDLYGETLLLMKAGVAPTIDRLRADIRRNHPAIGILDAPEYYDIEVFNRCGQGGYVMETPEVWSGVHPELVTVPVEWGYAFPWGIVAAKHPSAAVEELCAVLNPGGGPAPGAGA